MSGPIRSSIGPARHALTLHLADSLQHINARPAQEATTDQWEAWIQHLKNDRARMEAAIKRIDIQMQRWTDLMLRMTPEERVAEDGIFNNTANGDTGFMLVMEAGHERVVLLTTNIEVGEDALNRLNPNRRTPHREAPPRRPPEVKVRFPKNSLPEFEGDPTLWPSFWENFSSAIHNNLEYADIDRFNYLLGCLKGEAKRLIQGYFVTAANYPLAVGKLRERYGDEEQIKSDLRNELQRLTPANKFMTSIRSTFDNMERILLQLEQLGEDPNQTFVLSAIENKMPRWILVELEKAKMEMREKWEEMEENEEPFSWNASEARRCLGKIVRLHESVNKMCKSSPTQRPTYQKAEPKSGKKAAEEEARVFVPNEKERTKREGTKNKETALKDKGRSAEFPPRRVYPCIFCKSEEHFSTKCPKYPTGESRQKRLAVLKKCPRCFNDSSHEKCLSTSICDHCEGKHKHFVCSKFKLPKAKKETVQNHTLACPQTEEHTETLKLDCEKTPIGILLMTQRTVAKTNSLAPVTDVKVFLDPGASRSFITTHLAEKLGFKLCEGLPSVTIKAHGMFGHKTSFVSHPIKIQLGLRPPNNIYAENSLSFREFCLRTTPKITDKIAMPTISAKKFRVLKEELNQELTNLTTKMEEVDVLIGLDYFWEVVKGTKQLKNGFQLVETLFGPVICGGKIQTPTATHFNCATILHPTEEIFSYTLVEDDDQSKLTFGYSEMEKCYSLEGIGIRDSPLDNDDEMAQILFNKTIIKQGERYQVRWPFRPNTQPLPSNKNLCLKRLHSTIKRLKTSTDPPNMLEMYNQKFVDQDTACIIEEVSEMEEAGGQVHYLPHQAVYSAEKKKLRPVMDASAHLRGHPSLNDNLYRGPVLMPKVAAVLLNWRRGEIVIACDIMSAFLMLELHPEDRNVTRFFWLKDWRLPPTRDNLKVYRFRRVLFGAVASPYLLCGTIDYHLRYSEIAQRHPTIAEEIRKSIYMDNILILAPNSEVAIEKIKIVREIFLDAGMKLREFLANNQDALKGIDPEDRIVPRPKFLGIHWEVETDIMHFKFPEMVEETWTMRKVLRAVNSIFDPLGLVSPASFRARIFFQTLWDHKLKWDCPLPEETQQKWLPIISEWKNVRIAIPRFTNVDLNKNLQIHVFTDASELGFAAVVYARTSDGNNHSTCLLFAKSRLAPKMAKNGKLTIPKLELLGILIGARASNFVKKELNIEEARTILWSDSQIALHWVGSQEKQPVFIENRCNEIRKLNLDFRYIKTDENPADCGTRGVSGKDLINLKKWWQGPHWLQEEEENWPEILAIRPSEKDAEEETGQYGLKAEEQKAKKPKEQILNPQTFGSWEKMLFTMMFVLRFARSLFALVANVQPTAILHKFSFNGKFTGRDFRIAERIAIKHAQQRSVLPENEKIRKDFALFQDADEIWRSKSRLQMSSLPPDSIEPIFLPRDDRAVTLLVLDMHRRYFHAGVQLIHSVLMRQYCGITKRTIRSMLGQCLECKHRKALPYSPPPFPPYPIERVQRSPVFSHIGLDYLGPTLVTDPSGEKRKLWVMLITCLATRAVWLDSILDLSAQTFLNALRRFIAKRGCPSYILSDNATNFTLANKTLQNIWDKAISDSAVTKLAVREKINWKFIVPMASWEGGAYERLCGLAKNSFKRAIGKKILSLDNMNTLIAEVEAVLNSRPLVALDDNPDSIRALRPFDFLQDDGNPSLPLLESEDDEEWLPNPDSPEKMVLIYRQTLRCKNKFWKIWEQGYLNFLKERKQRHHKMRGNQNIEPKIGEVVIVADDSSPRSRWRLGRITELPEVGPLQMRSAKVRMANGNILKRALAHLIPLEITDSTNNLPENPKHDQILKFELASRPERKAKTAAKKRIAELAADEANVMSSQIKEKQNVKKQKIPFYFLTLLAAICATFTLTTADLLPYECQKSEEIKMLYVEDFCNSKGIVVYAKSHDRIPELCYKVVTCSQGYLTATSTKREWTCANKFSCSACPEWTATCSPYGEEDLKLPPQPYDLTIIEPPTEQDGVGDLPYILTHEIELFDGTRHSVRQLQLRTVDVFDEHYICVGKGPTIGSPHYCSMEDCGSVGTRFCLFPHRETSFYTANGKDLPIRAWGTRKKTKSLNKKRKKQLNCEGCHLECSHHGITLHFDSSTFKQMEICCGPYCYHRQNVSSPEEIKLPKDLLLSEHECKMILWTQKNVIFRKEISEKCPPQDICTLIDCYVCTDLIANSECWPTYAAVILGMIIALLLFCFCKLCAILFMCLTVLGQFFWCARMSLKALKLLQKIACKCCPRVRRNRSDQNLVRWSKSSKPESLTFEPFLPRPTARGILTVAFMIASICRHIQPAQCATQFTSFTATEEECTQSANRSQECKVTQQTVMSITPANHISQLLIKGPNGGPLGTMSIIVNEIAVECDKMSEYFTRSHDIMVHSSKRCPKQGSCTGQTCAETNASSKISELAAVNKYPGNTFCTDSCSFLMCGCGFPTTSCIFYRVHATERSKKIYEFFSCPSWRYSVSLTVIIIDAKGQKSVHKTHLLAGLKTTIAPGLKMTVNSISNAPKPILATRFLYDGKRIMIADGLSSPLFCGSRGEAEMFSGCKLKADACNCMVVDPTMNCQCEDGNLERHFEERPEKTFPIVAETFLLKNNGTRIFAVLPYAALQLQIGLENFHLTASYDSAICKMTPISLSGCYSCLVGAKLKVKCEPSTGTALAQISCDQKGTGNGWDFSIYCDGNEVETSLALNQARIDTICKVKCPAGDTVFEITGDLKYVAQKSWIPLQSKASEDIPSNNQLDWTFLLQFMGFPQNLYFLLAILGAGLVIILLIKCNPIFYAWKKFAQLFITIQFFMIWHFAISEPIDLPLILPHMSRDSPNPPPVQYFNMSDKHPKNNASYGPQLPAVHSDSKLPAPPKPPSQQQLQIGREWEELAHFIIQRDNKPPTSHELYEWWQKKSALGTAPTIKQQNPRKYEQGSEKYETREESEAAKRVAALKDPPGKRALQRMQQSALISQKEQVSIPPEGLQLDQKSATTSAAAEASINLLAETTPMAESEWDVTGLTVEQQREIIEIRKTIELLYGQGQQLLNRYKREAQESALHQDVKKANDLIEKTREKLDNHSSAASVKSESSNASGKHGPYIPPNYQRFDPRGYNTSRHYQGQGSSRFYYGQNERHSHGQDGRRYQEHDDRRAHARHYPSNFGCDEGGARPY